VKLEWIKTTACPDCGCDHVIAESVDKEISRTGPPAVLRHANGQPWEKRTFLCGLVVSWVPNFNAERNYVPCEQTPEAKAKTKRRAELQKEIDQLQRHMSSL